MSVFQHTKGTACWTLSSQCQTVFIYPALMSKIWTYQTTSLSSLISVWNYHDPRVQRSNLETLSLLTSTCSDLSFYPQWSIPRRNLEQTITQSNSVITFPASWTNSHLSGAWRNVVVSLRVDGSASKQFLLGVQDVYSNVGIVCLVQSRINKLTDKPVDISIYWSRTWEGLISLRSWPELLEMQEFHGRSSKNSCILMNATPSQMLRLTRTSVTGFASSSPTSLQRLVAKFSSS